MSADLAVSSQPATAAIAVAGQGQRRHFRQKIRTLVCVRLDSENGGILRDLSESGFAAQVIKPLRTDRPVHVQFDLPNSRLHLEVDGRIAWTDSFGQAGIEFVAMPPRSRRLLKEWLFTQLLSDAYRAVGDGSGELLFSESSRRPAIRLDPPPLRLIPPPRQEERPLRIMGIGVTRHRFSRIVDGVVLLCAVLLFGVTALLLTDVLPSWPLTFAFLAGATAVFASLYWFVFSLWFGGTPGVRLAQLAYLDVVKESCTGDDDTTRFR